MIPQGFFTVLGLFQKKKKEALWIIPAIEERFKGFLPEPRGFPGHNPHMESPAWTFFVHVKSSGSFLLVIIFEVQSRRFLAYDLPVFFMGGCSKRVGHPTCLKKKMSQSF